MGVYSGVYEYTQQIQEQIQSIQSIQVFGHLLSCRQDPCSIIARFGEYSFPAGQKERVPAGGFPTVFPD